MSHQALITLEINDKAALVEAAKALGMSIAENARPKQYGGDGPVAEMVLSHPNMRYDVAVKFSNGKATLSTDWYTGSVESVVGKSYGRLMQEYGAARAIAAAKAKGLTVSRFSQPDGSIKIRIGGFR